ncbi:hypothetical protein [Streptomyces sp. NPDC058572]
MAAPDRLTTHNKGLPPNDSFEAMATEAFSPRRRSVFTLARMISSS